MGGEKQGNSGRRADTPITMAAHGLPATSISSGPATGPFRELSISCSSVPSLRIVTPPRQASACAAPRGPFESPAVHAEPACLFKQHGIGRKPVYPISCAVLRINRRAGIATPTPTNHKKYDMNPLPSFPRAGATNAAALHVLRCALPLLALAAPFACPEALAAGPFYQQANLVSDLPGVAGVTDPHLIAAWGATHSATSGWWVTSPLGGVAAVYDGNGQPIPAANPLVVTIPAPAGMTIPSIPTGIVANGSANFNLTPDHPARFVFVTRTGTVSGWNPQVNPTNAIIMVPPVGVADYTGVTIAQRSGVDHLYVANFGRGSVDVFDGAFQPVTLPAGAFTDSRIPDTFSVFNVQLIRDELYVTYASKEIFNAPTGGAKQGYVNVFDAEGTLVRRLNNGPWMNAPWGVALAPDEFGHFGGNVLVGMFGDGGVAAFDAENGNFQGMARGRKDEPLTLPQGLWALGFGNNAAAGSSATLFFATDLAVGGNLHGLFGSLTPSPAQNDDN